MSHECTAIAFLELGKARLKDEPKEQSSSMCKFQMLYQNLYGIWNPIQAFTSTPIDEWPVFIAGKHLK